MNVRPLVASMLFALGTLSASTYSPSASARVSVGVSVHIAPPPLRYERVVVRPGYVWSPGYWRWSGNAYIWVGGYHVPARNGYHWVAPVWAPYGHGHRHWRYHGGYWRRR